MKKMIFLLVFIPHLAFAEVVEKIVAMVNSEIITLSDIETFRKKLTTGGLVDDALLKMSSIDELQKSKKAIVDHLIAEKILDSEVKRLSLSVTMDRVEKEIRSIVSRNGIARPQLIAALKEKGVMFSDYQDFIKTTLERQTLIERAVSSKIKISNEDIRAFYLKEKGQTDSQVFEYTIAHILFLPKNGGSKAAEERAKKVLEKLSAGQKFDDLAGQFSEDPGFANNGLLGTFKAGDMLKEFEASVKNLRAGETTGIVKSRAGYHVVKLLNKKLIADPELKKEQARIQSTLFAQAFKRQFSNWLDQKRKEAFIRIN